MNWEEQQSCSWGEDGLILLWDLEVGQLLERMSGHHEVGVGRCKKPIFRLLKRCHVRQ